MSAPAKDGAFIPAQVVSQALADRIDELVAWLGLAPLHRVQNCFWPINPVRGDRGPGSFVIYAKGHAKAGGWVEYAVPGQGAKPSLAGDAMDLCAYIQTGDPKNRREGYRIGLQFLGWEGAAALDRPEQLAARRALERDREIAEKNARDKLDQDRSEAFKGWLNDANLTPGDTVWTYLLSRGIDLYAWVGGERGLPRALRYRARAKIDGAYSPAMTALISSPEGKPWAVHRTFLKPDGSGKAALATPRRIWPGGYNGGAIRLAKGVSKLSPEEMARDGLAGDVLAIGEGVETMLSVAMLCPSWRIWAAGNVGMIGEVVVPACVEMVILVGENDDGKEARAAFERSVGKMAAQAKAKKFELFRVQPPAGHSDYNDALQASLLSLKDKV